MKAVLAFGANLPGDLGDPVAQIARAARSLAESPGITVTAASAMYATPPWGVEDQAEFRNSVLVVEVDEALFSPLDLLHRCQDEEKAAHRVRHRHWGPRTLDIDLISLWSAGVEIHSGGRWGAELVLPHPWAHARAFVLVPWNDADPAATLDGQPVAGLMASCPAGDLAGVRALPDVAWAP
ncbi:2-amino-4-hydroxy-6-hydroxymethyldihydropteridine pyrophosphokinase [Corynebacterium provencense]|uniref:2-amino-4-hydroxy-6-hydroxymethyldihydropteridine diphosphokinase n=1 Tax=Corynebacterium provencense TaxID=1737425 RepID=A0A2Z3YQE0_9CORY|nr:MULTISPECIES: 2-amino-4-hydroxy-6-hydroxymethyldihydropteridine diphosphokinase [Corynebacterium]AWT27008.1 2-amino-4-hydroxy-6-hydroxymethyldihydropteridine pyrophosphokinase [Corynebacterium provencense]MCI1255184.1 2-amino-4-hydroxy-6-hydroxymethyldihydropteridine diphosphokinase [Corynebacterium provencense]